MTIYPYLMKTLLSWAIANTRIKHMIWTFLLFAGYVVAVYLPDSRQGTQDALLHLFYAALICLSSILWGFCTDTGIGSGAISYLALILVLVYLLQENVIINIIAKWVKWPFIIGGVIGIIDCIYTAINIDEVISRRMRWRESRVGLLDSNVKYCIDRLFASASCATVWFISALVLFKMQQIL